MWTLATTPFTASEKEGISCVRRKIEFEKIECIVMTQSESYTSSQNGKGSQVIYETIGNDLQAA